MLAGRKDLDGARDLHLPWVLLDRVAEAEVSHGHGEGEGAERVRVLRATGAGALLPQCKHLLLRCGLYFFH